MLMKQGDIFYANFGIDNLIGGEQRGIRPVLIIQNDRGNRFSGTIQVACLTSAINKAPLPTHVVLDNKYKGLKYPTTVLIEQIKTIDKTRLIRYLDTITRKDMYKVKKALIASFDLEGVLLDV